MSMTRSAVLMLAFVTGACGGSESEPVTYSVRLARDVAAHAARFAEPISTYWQACLEALTDDASVRDGLWVDSTSQPSRTFLFEIAEEISISGETLRVLTSEFLAQYAVVSVVDDENRTVTVINLRVLR